MYSIGAEIPFCAVASLKVMVGNEERCLFTAITGQNLQINNTIANITRANYIDPRRYNREERKLDLRAAVTRSLGGRSSQAESAVKAMGMKYLKQKKGSK